MSGINGIGGAMSVDRVMALRAQILERNAALARANAANAANATGANESVQPAGPASFSDSLTQALNSVNDSQNRAADISASYERGETIDIAKVMLARQEASV
ncbi:MAG TPA: flagellar hook-basal body complex protein FliE, partial [Sphingomonas sp.]|nr:flagellar hook-basal body complex protein FliE [Sphingomonas sp.]